MIRDDRPSVDHKAYIFYNRALAEAFVDAMGSDAVLSVDRLRVYVPPGETGKADWLYATKSIMVDREMLPVIKAQEPILKFAVDGAEAVGDKFLKLRGPRYLLDKIKYLDFKEAGGGKPVTVLYSEDLEGAPVQQVEPVEIVSIRPLRHRA